MQSKRLKKLIIANAVLLILVAAGVTYAWFASTYGTIVEADQVQVIADSALEISFNNSDWSSYLNLNSPGSPVDFDVLKFTDITGSGDGNFLKPALNQFGGYAEVVTADEWQEPRENLDYISFPLYMRSTDELDIYLGVGSSVAPQTDSDHLITNLGVNNNKSPYGNFSRDLVAGAVRVSAVDNSASKNRIFTWIPCPNIYLPFGPSDTISTYDTISITAKETDTFNGISPYQHKYYASSTATLLSEVTDNLIKGTITDDNEKLLVKLDEKTEAATYYTGMVTVYIWLEGCDNEARRAFVGGNFTVSLNISAKDPSPTT